MCLSIDMYFRFFSLYFIFIVLGHVLKKLCQTQKGYPHNELFYQNQTGSKYFLTFRVIIVAGRHYKFTSRRKVFEDEIGEQSIRSKTYIATVNLSS